MSFGSYVPSRLGVKPHGALAVRGRISLEHHVDLSDNSILGAKIASEHSGNPCGIVQVLEVNLTNHVRVTV